MQCERRPHDNTLLMLVKNERSDLISSEENQGLGLTLGLRIINRHHSHHTLN
jgi:hypothetical protein